MREEDTPVANCIDVQLPHTTNDANITWIPLLRKWTQKLVCKTKELIIIDQAFIMATIKNKWV